MVDTGIFMLTFIYLPFNSLFICLKSELFTYCLECGIKRLGHGWIGAIQILIIIIIIIDMKMTRFQRKKKVLHLVSFWKREFLELGSGLLE